MITIITPCFNSEQNIERTICSVLQQKETTDVEYIVIDGRSNDKTMDIVNRYRDQIDKVVSEKDRGIADAYNKGIRLASGDLIGIVAADDRLVPNVLQRVAVEYDGKSDVFVGNNIADVGTSRFRLVQSERNLNELRYRMSICHPSMLVSKSAYEKYGFYSLDYRSAMDRELTLRFYMKGATFQFSNLYINIFTSYGGISTSDTSIPDREDDLISEKYGLSKEEVQKYRTICNKKNNSLRCKVIKLISKATPEKIKTVRARNNSNYIFEDDIRKLY